MFDREATLRMEWPALCMRIDGWGSLPAAELDIDRGKGKYKMRDLCTANPPFSVSAKHAICSTKRRRHSSGEICGSINSSRLYEGCNQEV